MVEVGRFLPYFCDKNCRNGGIPQNGKRPYLCSVKFEVAVYDEHPLKSVQNTAVQATSGLKLEHSIH